MFSKKKPQTIKQNLDAVIIVGQRINPKIYDEMMHKAQSKGVKVRILTAGQHGLKSKDIKKMKGWVNQDTVFHVDIHGGAEKNSKGEYSRHNKSSLLTKVKHAINPRKFPIAEDTSEILKNISNLTQDANKDNDKNTEVHLYSCQGGTAVKNVPKGIKLYAHGGKDKATYQDILLKYVEHDLKAHSNSHDRTAADIERLSTEIPYATYVAEHKGGKTPDITEIPEPKTERDFKYLNIFKNVNFKKFKGDTPKKNNIEEENPQEYLNSYLTSAVRGQDTEKANVSINAGADVNNEKHPLNEALYNARKALINTDDSYSKAKSLVKTLLDSGADPTQKDQFGITTQESMEEISTAIGKKLKNIPNKLLKLGRARAKELDGMIEGAFKRQSESVNYNEVINLSINPESNTNLKQAVYDGNIKNIRQEIKESSDINEQDNKVGTTALMVAANKGDHGLEATKELIKAGADANKQDYKYGISALMLAVNKGEKATHTINDLLEAGASPDLQDAKGTTALMLAVKKGDLNAVKMLQKAGADLDIQDNEGNTALMVAVKKGYTQIFEKIKDFGANIDLQDKEGNSAIMHAVKSGDKGMVEVLQKAEARLDLQDKGGNTALMLASKDGNKEMMEQLKDSHSSNLVNNEGKKAKDLVPKPQARKSRFDKFLPAKRNRPNDSNSHWQDSIDKEGSSLRR